MENEQSAGHELGDTRSEARGEVIIIIEVIISVSADDDDVTAITADATVVGPRTRIVST